MNFGVVLRVEDAVQDAVSRALRRLGRPVQVRPFPGYGTDDWVRVGGRVVIETAKPPGGEARAASTLHAVRANLGQFVTWEVPYARVRVEVGSRTWTVSADREGYVDSVVRDVPLAPGRHPVTLTPVEPEGDPAEAVVHVPDPSADLAVISDIDDTIVDSGIAHGVVATVTTALLRDSATRVPLEGAAELYRALAHHPDGGPERPFFYLSTSPWNLAGFLSRFLERHGFPSGPLLLTDWGPGSAGLFRISTRSHKLTALRRLAGELPQRRFVLIGDSGQEDAEIYTAFALEHPDRVAAVYIRRAGVVAALKQERLDQCAQSLVDADVPFVLADDSAAMLKHAQELGLASG